MVKNCCCCVPLPLGVQLIAFLQALSQLVLCVQGFRTLRPAGLAFAMSGTIAPMLILMGLLIYAFLVVKAVNAKDPNLLRYYFGFMVLLFIINFGNNIIMRVVVDFLNKSENGMPIFYSALISKFLLGTLIFGLIAGHYLNVIYSLIQTFDSRGNINSDANRHNLCEISPVQPAIYVSGNPWQPQQGAQLPVANAVVVQNVPPPSSLIPSLPPLPPPSPRSLPPSFFPSLPPTQNLVSASPQVPLMNAV